MTVTARVLVGSKALETVQTTQYTAANIRAILDKVTATNGGASNITVSINLVTVSGSAGASNLIVSARTVLPGETYTFPELVGHVLDAGGFVSAVASGAGIVFRMSGREVS